MKKLICIIMSAIIIIMLFMPSFTICAADTNESKKITEFTNGIADLARKYDSGKEFVAPEEDETAQIQAFSARNSEEVTDSTETEYTLQDFQTARLIIRADGNFDKCGALEDVSGFEDFHILQYESPEAAMSAYNQLQNEKNVIEVDLDLVCTYADSTLDNPDIIPKDEFLNDWSRDRTQSKRLQEYLAGADIPMKKIIVGVVDTGIDYNHEIFKGRVERTKFNVTASGNADDEMDDEIAYHGTTVSSVIVNNSPKNVKVAVYKVGDNDSMTVTAIGAGLLAAIEKCDVINTSLSSLSDVSLITKIVLEAYSKNIPIFAAVGNRGVKQIAPVPANVPECIAVSATDLNNTTTSMNTMTPNSDVSAPGEDVAVAIPGNRYTRFSGTSYSTPYAAALGAILKAVNPEMTVDEIDTRLKETSFDAERYNESQSSQGGFMDNYCSLWDGVGMIQFSNALGLEKLTAPEINLEDKVYVGEQPCIITCSDKNATILYTTDGTYPALENADVYTEPFQITQHTRIRAVAYYANEGYYSDEIEATPRIQYTDSDEHFVISNDGIIQRYKGNVSDLFVPEAINGITVTGFVKGAFNTVIGLTLPETVTEIPVSAFAKNSSIEFVRGEGIVTVKSGAFSQSNIMYVEFPVAECIQDQAFNLAAKFCVGYFPNVKIIEGDAFSYSRIISFYGPEVHEIDDSAFGQCSRLEKVYFPQCTIINEIWGNNGVFDSCSRLVSVEMPLITNLTAYALNDTAILKADFPYIKTIEEKAFYNCFELKYVNMPALLTVPKQAFGSYGVNPIAKPRFFRFDSITQIEKDAFGKYPTARIELSHLETAQSLPQTEGCIISMPSTFRECTEDTKGRNYKVYGTKGTYAEQWANENGHTFVEISQDTAVLTPLPEKYTDADGVLTADVIGFNRTYQWYGSFTADNTAGTPIDGATDKDFNPAEYPAYPYYYCVVTSTDVGYDSIEIRTGVCENTTFVSADYSEYDKVVVQAKALDRSLYTDLTELDEALSADISGLSNAQQNIVDEQTAKIKAALDKLVLKPADYSRVNEQINTVPEHLEYYTDETVNSLNKILNGIDYGLDITKQEVVNSYAEQLQNAISALEYKPADYAEYDKAVSEANGLDKEKYVDFSRVEKELAVDVGGRNITQQEEIDLQTKAILAAIDALEEKPQGQPIINPEQDKTNGSTTPDKPSKNESVISPMTGSETYTGVFTALAALSFATVLLVRKKKDN